MASNQPVPQDLGGPPPIIGFFSGATQYQANMPTQNQATPQGGTVRLQYTNPSGLSQYQSQPPIGAYQPQSMSSGSYLYTQAHIPSAQQSQPIFIGPNPQGQYQNQGIIAPQPQQASSGSNVYLHAPISLHDSTAPQQWPQTYGSLNSHPSNLVPIAQQQQELSSTQPSPSPHPPMSSAFQPQPVANSSSLHNERTNSHISQPHTKKSGHNTQPRTKKSGHNSPKPKPIFNFSQLDTKQSGPPKQADLSASAPLKPQLRSFGQIFGSIHKPCDLTQDGQGPIQSQENPLTFRTQTQPHSTRVGLSSDADASSENDSDANEQGIPASRGQKRKRDTVFFGRHQFDRLRLFDHSRYCSIHHMPHRDGDCDFSTETVAVYKEPVELRAWRSPTNFDGQPKDAKVLTLDEVLNELAFIAKYLSEFPEFVKQRDQLMKELKDANEMAGRAKKTELSGAEYIAQSEKFESIVQEGNLLAHECFSNYQHTMKQCYREVLTQTRNEMHKHNVGPAMTSKAKDRPLVLLFYPMLKDVRESINKSREPSAPIKLWEEFVCAMEHHAEQYEARLTSLSLKCTTQIKLDTLFGPSIPWAEYRNIITQSQLQFEPIRQRTRAIPKFVFPDVGKRSTELTQLVSRFRIAHSLS